MTRPRMNPPHITEAYRKRGTQLSKCHKARRILADDNARMATELEAAQQEIDRVTAQRDELIRIGSQFANLAFNVTQGAKETLTLDARAVAVLKSLRDQWDGARDRHCNLDTSLARKVSEPNTTRT